MRRRSIDFPDETYDAILAQAKQEGRSFSRQVVWILTQPASIKTVQNDEKIIKNNHFAPHEFQELLELAGSESVLQRAIMQFDKLPPENQRSPYGYVKKVLSGKRNQNEPKIIKNNQNGSSGLVPDLTPEEVAKRQAKAERIAKERGLGGA